MSADTLERRKTLAIELLTQLKDVRSHIDSITEDLGGSSESFLNRVYEEHNGKIMEKVNLFNQNVEKVKELNQEITAVINDWFRFVKSEKEMASLFFPIRLYSRRKKVRSKTKELKQEITGIGIKNRLIREDIQRMEGNLEYEATQRLKKDVRYTDYLSHLQTKSLLIEELQYLLPTLSGVSIHELNIDKLDDAIASLA